MAIAQQQHELNEQLLSVVRASWSGRHMHTDSAWCADLEGAVPRPNPLVSREPSARSEAVCCATHSTPRPAHRSVVLSMGTLPEPMTSSMANFVASRGNTPPQTPGRCTRAASSDAALCTATSSLPRHQSATPSSVSGSCTSDLSDGKQLSTRVAGLPPQLSDSHSEGHSRASSYESTLGPLESLRSHFSPDAESDDDSSAGQRAAVAALLAEGSGA